MVPKVNLATISVLARNGWRVAVPRDQGAAARCRRTTDGWTPRDAGAQRSAFAEVDHVVVNAAGCGAHMRDYGDLADDLALPVRDLMAFLYEEGLPSAPKEVTG